MPTPKGAIAAGHPITVAAGVQIFEAGGNAFDAAVGAVMASFVAEPMLTSVAGGGFLLAHTADQQDVLFDFFTQTPRHKRNSKEIDFYPVSVQFGSGVTQEFHIGLGSMAVPGTIQGLLQVHQRLGRLPLSVVAEPAIAAAQSGVEVNEFQAYCFHILSPIILASDAARQIYVTDGKLPQVGDRLKMPELADSLRYLVAEGARGFYEGEIAQRLVRDCQEQGGYLTLEDLAQYQVIERQPLMTCYRGNTFLTNPPPSSGGTLIAFALGLLSGLDLSAIAPHSTAYVQVLAEVMRLTNQARQEGYDGRLYEGAIAQEFLAPDHLAKYLANLSRFNPRLSPAVNKWGSTTHVSAIDREGNAASVTTSNGEGSSYVIPGTGIMVNNMLGEADLHPQGFHQWQPNVRISSMMSTTMVLKNQRPELVLGSGGSNRIRTAILQVISQVLDFGQSIEAAVSSPRLHWEGGVLNLEPGFDPLPLQTQEFPFNGTVEQWPQQNMFFGGVHAVTCDETGDLAGAGDRRRGGAFARV
ncbi:MAG: gamma-glutamyltransferase [Oculatellaceae cyanobacterium Prado106]|nr:gamma-glutamyltransferase [Oculatellaceae cyanobacterium Prado106]